MERGPGGEVPRSHSTIQLSSWLEKTAGSRSGPGASRPTVIRSGRHLLRPGRAAGSKGSLNRLWDPLIKSSHCQSEGGTGVHTGRSAGTNWNRPDLPGPLPGKSRLDTRLVSCAASAQTAKPPGERQAPIISAGPQAKLRL